MAGLRSVDTQIDSTKRKLEELTAAALGAKAAMAGMSPDTSKFAADLEAMKGRVSALERKFVEADAAGKRVGVSDTQITKVSVMAHEAAKLRDRFIEADIASRGGGGGGGFAEGKGNPYGSPLGGILPGGARARPAALLTLLGLGASAAVGAGPGVLGLGAAALPAAVEGLVGAAVTLKLAFSGITKAAFTTQKAFDKLDPAQQQFVQSLRSIDAGFIKPLEKLAQTNLFPKLVDALHLALSPAAVGAVRGAVGGFSNAIGGGAVDLGHLFGSAGFASNFGAVMQADARYLKDFIDGFGNLIDALFVFQHAAIPFTDWLSKATLGMTGWIDASLKADAANGRLAHFFDMAKASLQSIGGLFMSIAHLAGSFADAVGFQNSLNLINLLSDAIQFIADFLEKNRRVLNDFFAGAIGSMRDVLGFLRAIAPALTAVLRAVDSLARGFGGFKNILDGLIALQLFRIFQNWVTGMAAVKGSEVALAGETAILGGASATAAGEVGGLRLALLALGGPEVLAAIAAGIGGFIAFKALLNNHGGFEGQKAAIAKNYGGQIKAGMSLRQVDEKLANLRSLGLTDDPIFAALTKARALLLAQHSAMATLSAADANRLKIEYGKTIAPDVGGIGLIAGAGGGGSRGGGSINLTLPQKYQDAITAATAHHGNLEKANAAAYAYYEKMLKNPHLTQAQKTAIYGAEAPYVPYVGGTPGALEQDPAKKTPHPTGINLLSQGLQQRLATAQGNDATSTLATARALRAADVAAQAYLMHLKTTVTSQKELSAIARENTALEREKAKANREIVAGLKKQAIDAAHNQIDALLGISHGDGSTNVQAFRNRERNTLMQIANRAKITGLDHGTIPQIISALQHHGIHFSPAALKDFQNMQKAIEIATKTGARITAEESSKQIALLKQIKDNTDPKSMHPNTYHTPSISEILKGLPPGAGTPAMRKIIADRLAGIAAMGGKIPSGPTAFGLPTNGHPSTSSGHTFIDKVEIMISGTGKGAKELAHEVRIELMKTSRRNPVQVRGPNAGRNGSVS